MGAFFTSDGLVALATLTSLEIVLGVDNLVFIAIVAAKVPAAQQPMARRIGLGLALVTRILLLLTLSWIMGLTQPMFHLGRHGVSGRDLILLAGGLFLVAKATWEIYAKVEGTHEDAHAAGARSSMAAVVVQIMILDIVFSLDSVITAVGMVDDVPIMVTAIVLVLVALIVRSPSSCAACCVRPFSASTRSRAARCR